MALALDLGDITQSDSPLTFAMGLFPNDTIWYERNGGRFTKQIPLWRRRWSNPLDAVRS
jgi:hypothetical protein